MFACVHQRVRGGGRECNQQIPHRTGCSETCKLNIALLVYNGWLAFSNFKVFVKFSAYEHGLNCGLDFRAEICKTFFHHIRRDLIFKWYHHSDGMCCRVGFMECAAGTGLLPWNLRID